MLKYNHLNLRNWLFFDIEVVREYKSYHDFAQHHDAELWKKANHKYYVDHINEFGEKNIDEITYENNAGFFPEYGKVIASGFGVFKNAEDNLDGGLTKEVGAIANDNEKYLLERIATFLESKNGPNIYLCGFNIAEFDIPYLIKRMIKYRIKIPQLLINAVSGKPWEVKVVDIMRDWKFNGLKNTSLGTLQEFLGVESSKNGEVNGMNLASKYWACNSEEERKEFLKKVGAYAKADVSTIMDIALVLGEV